MLSTEPARCCGFRDSYLFFTKHPKLYKVLLSDEEKRDLIDREILPSSYKGRNIGVVTARSVFREFGARIIVGGRRITDDYKVTDAREAGEVEGELADPEDRIPEKKEDYNRNRYVAWHGASEVYRSSGPVGGGAVAHPGKPGPVGKRRNNITLQNWQHLHAKEASRFNAALVEARRANLDGVYDSNTNLMLYPKIMQPTHARWEWVAPSTGTEHGDDERKRLTNGDHTNHPSATIFPPVPPVVSRNFTVLDTYFSSPPVSQPGYPGPDGHVADPSSGPNGLSSISDELVAELPEACRRAFEVEREKERAWKGQWGAEAQSGSRGQIRIGLVGHPV
ncbi:chromatin remodelling complex Rsc7/Swp82 subunit-domain-containing protein [Neohortaea acidophila]|uniref:Chromatin remodelling complex Rsc7/Swp82 subunit-domain-containing protein n=1 Tax=Neohortaea acidophila TaxID=245834 RepID=A0A6A6Q6L7_9PEZI|nr:chromatin remodelling complex Rsc7/Swp82 subunit-domain-containing protein [Neohortaea acidophila]KAF2487679.1 chromatin remodelling complex Rsc7/Swp82 subunit-domain-containing protein [Neohortaea acidophila]